MKELHTMFALYNFPLNELERELQEAKPILLTSDPVAITRIAGSIPDDDEHYCVGYFLADDDNEYVKGGDYDTVCSHYAAYAVRY